MNEIALISYACGYGAQKKECQDGPLALKVTDLNKILSALGITAIWSKIFKARNEGNKTSNQIIVEYCQELYNQVNEALKSETFPLIIGGDHTMALGTWPAVVKFYNSIADFGLIWIDAHLDIHTQATSHSKAMHGMSLSYLIGKGDDNISHWLGDLPLLNPEHICYIGTRSFEPEEDDLVKQLGIKVYDMRDIRQKGFNTVIQEAISYVSTNTKGFGISLDMDAFDPQIAPGVGSPVFGGILREEALIALQGIAHNPKLRAIEISEFNPTLDRDNLTLNLINDIVKQLFMKSKLG